MKYTLISGKCLDFNSKCPGTMFPTFCMSSQIAYVYHPKSLTGSLHCPLCESHTHLFSKAKSWSNRLPNSLTGTLNYFKVSLSIYITQTVSLLYSPRKYHTHFFSAGKFSSNSLHFYLYLLTSLSNNLYRLLFKSCTNNSFKVSIYLPISPKWSHVDPVLCPL